MLGKLLAFGVMAVALLPAYGTQMHKCRSTSGGVLYSNEPCEKQGLKSMGTVPDRVTVLPATPPAPKAASGKGAAPTGEENRAHLPPARVSPATPLMERLVK